MYETSRDLRYPQRSARATAVLARSERSWRLALRERAGRGRRRPLHAMTEGKETLRTRIAEGLGELKTMRDEIRIKLHLAGMDARDAWQKLEPRIDELEARARDLRDDMVERLKDAVEDARNAARRVQSEIRRAESP
jgi:predicted  nucleic acid-binding Zn-ribbon protein